MNWIFDILLWSFLALAVFAEFYWLFQDHLSFPRKQTFRKHVRAACFRHANQTFAIFDPMNKIPIDELQLLADRFLERIDDKSRRFSSGFQDWLSNANSKESVQLPDSEHTDGVIMIARAELVDAHKHPDWHRDWVGVFGFGRKHRLATQIPWNSKDAQKLYKGHLEPV